MSAIDARSSGGPATPTSARSEPSASAANGRSRPSAAKRLAKSSRSTFRSSCSCAGSDERTSRTAPDHAAPSAPRRNRAWRLRSARLTQCSWPSTRPNCSVACSSRISTSREASSPSVRSSSSRLSGREAPRRLKPVTGSASSALDCPSQSHVAGWSRSSRPPLTATVAGPNARRTHGPIPMHPRSRGRAERSSSRALQAPGFSTVTPSRRSGGHSPTRTRSTRATAPSAAASVAILASILRSRRAARRRSPTSVASDSRAAVARTKRRRRIDLDCKPASAHGRPKSFDDPGVGGSLSLAFSLSLRSSWWPGTESNRIAPTRRIR